MKTDAYLTNEYVVCDNINLETIVVEYEIFYYQRFKTHVQICKRIENCAERFQNKKRNTNKHTSEKINLRSCFKMNTFNSNKSTTDAESDLVIYNSLFYEPKNNEKKDTNSLPDIDWIYRNDWKEYTNIILQVKNIFNFLNRNLNFLHFLLINNE